MMEKNEVVSDEQCNLQNSDGASNGWNFELRQAFPYPYSMRIGWQAEVKSRKKEVVQNPTNTWMVHKQFISFSSWC